MDDKEKVYDDEVAPLLRQVCDLCEKHGMPMLAVVQFNQTDWGHTAYTSGPYPLANMRHCYYFAKSGNFDASMGAVLDDARKYGHSSIYLTLLGVPQGPSK
jgi:hypothetical protein